MYQIENQIKFALRPQIRATTTNARCVCIFDCYAPLSRGGYPQTLNLQPKRADLLRFKFYVRDIKKMKAQNLGRKRIKFKVKFDRRAAKSPAKFERERLNFKIKMLKYRRRLREVVSRDVRLCIFIAVRVGVFVLLL